MSRRATLILNYLKLALLTLLSVWLFDIDGGYLNEWAWRRWEVLQRYWSNVVSFLKAIGVAEG